MELNDNLFVRKYRPKTINDTIMPAMVKRLFTNMVKEKKINHLLLTGGAGMGKTTTAIALCNDIGADYTLINGSKDASIDLLRNDLTMYVSTGGLFSDNKVCKVVIIDEADRLSFQVQKALLGFIEEHEARVRFIFTGNYKGKIENAIQSRCTNIDFKFEKEERPILAKAMYTTAINILEKEGIEYTPEAVFALVKKNFPDFRSTLGAIDSYSIGGKLDEGVLTAFQRADLTPVIDMLRKQQWDGLRKWVDENAVNGIDTIYSELWKQSRSYIEVASEPILVGLLDDYQRYAPNSADPNIALMQLFTQMIVQLTFKVANDKPIQ